MPISSPATDAAIAKYTLEIERLQDTIDNLEQQIDGKTQDLEEIVEDLQKAEGRRTNLKKAVEIHQATSEDLTRQCRVLLGNESRKIPK